MTGRELTSHDEEEKTYQRAITDIEDVAGESAQTHLAQPVEHCIKENITGAGTGCEEGSPPPVVVLGAEQEIDHEDSGSGAGDNH